VQRVIPMLPRLLCEELCSLHPGYPRFAFSIVWEVDEDGHIYKEWAGRSVISSRAKLAYPMVQQMIEGCFDPAPWGVQLHEGATWDEVRADCCGTLQQTAARCSRLQQCPLLVCGGLLPQA
jgi:DIS3-like exonuclease 2